MDANDGLDSWRARRGVALIALTFAASTCRRAPEVPIVDPVRTDATADRAVSVAGPRQDAPAAASASAPPEDDATAAARLNQAICRRPRCCVTRVMPAGVGSDGTRYTVVRVDLRPRHRHCEPPRWGSEEDMIDPAALEHQESGEPNQEQCERYRWDLVAERDGNVRWRQPLQIDYWCTSSFGMGGGEDGLTADATTGTIKFSSENGSAWRGDDEVVLGVDPLRVVEFSIRSWWRGGQDEHQIDWSWETFSGRQSWSTELCASGDENGPPDAATGADLGDNGKPIAASNEVIIPRVALPADFVRAGWSSTALGDCSARVDGQQRGFTIHGEAQAPAGDAELRVVTSSGGVLFVEVTDDRVVPTAKTWVKADHLELWRIVADDQHPSGCYRPDPHAKALQWGIGLDGRVYKAQGAPAAAPTVRVSRTERGARFRIVLPDEGRGLTVVYSDSDDGVHQKRLIATSKLAPRRPWTVGDVSAIARQRAICVVDGATLRPKVAPLARVRDLLLPTVPLQVQNDAP